MSIIESVATEIAKKVLERIAKRLPTRRGDHPWSVEKLRPHLIEVTNWSSRIELFGLEKAKATDSDTVGLFTSLPRKFRTGSTSGHSKPESFLLTGGGNYLLLGDPGA